MRSGGKCHRPAATCHRQTNEETGDDQFQNSTNPRGFPPWRVGNHPQTQEGKAMTNQPATSPELAAADSRQSLATRAKARGR
jgi:hypothetical protein